MAETGKVYAPSGRTLPQILRDRANFMDTGGAGPGTDLLRHAADEIERLSAAALAVVKLYRNHENVIALTGYDTLADQTVGEDAVTGAVDALGALLTEGGRNVE